MARLSLDETIPHLSWGKSLEACDGYFVIWANFVIIRRVGKGQGEQALLFQVCFCQEI